jgi:hypothetical protein
VKTARHGRHAIPSGPDSCPNGDARRVRDAGGIVAKKSVAPPLRKLSTALAGDAVVCMYRAAYDSVSSHLFEDFSYTGTVVPCSQPVHTWSGELPTR